MATACPANACVPCYQLTIALGLSGILVFVGHALRPTDTTARIGWPASPNFQFELGAVGLGFAIAGLLCLVIRNLYYWFGAVDLSRACRAQSFV
jgi:hypothetical protein